MSMIIKEMQAADLDDVNRCNGEFAIEARLDLSLEEGEIRYRILEIPATKKRYQNDQIDLAAYLADPNKTIFLAYFDEQIAGQIILRKNWNNYAYIEDIAVDAKFRRRGIGKELILQAKQWAREHSLAGIMLETQDNNVNACQFYEKCGFQLGGFDKYLYQGLNPETNEVALYWYLFF